MAGRGGTPDITMKSPGNAPAARRMLLVAGEGHLGTYPLIDGKALTVGRDPTCDVPLNHPKISRRHATIHAGEAIEVEDLGSTNGTRLGGRRLADGERCRLEKGASLQLGPFVAVIVESPDSKRREGPLRAALTISDPTPAGVPEVVTRVANGTVSVLISGETGVGKEVLAHTIHELSGRTGQFVAINCASLSEQLLESELFGYERGAFTGANAAKPGLFEVASKGTVFLDEIGELPQSLQAKLLRVLETRSVYRVGGVKAVNLDVRFLAATHRNLADEVERGAFRRDLFFRVNGIALTILPLRARREAIPGLAQKLLGQAMPPGRKAPRIGAAALEALMAHEWNGNVRELRTVMERSVVVCDGDEVQPVHLMFDAPGQAAERPSPAASSSAAAAAPPAALAPDGDDERERIIAALAACAGNQTHAARKLGISRTTLIHKIAVHRIPRPRKPHP